MSQIQNAATLFSRIQSGEVSRAALTGVLVGGLLGVFMILGVGLLGAEVIHNAAHDVRHGLSFPCH